MKSKIHILIIHSVILLLLSSCIQTNNKMEYYSGKDMRNMVFIERDKQTKAVKLTVKEDSNWKLLAGDKPDSIDFSKLLLIGEKAGIFNIESTNNTNRQYFIFKNDEGTILLSERHLPMEGGYNFRDLGGFKTKEGKYTKWGKLFRSDDLNHLTENDLNYLASIPMNTIVDFRSGQEIEKAPDKNPESLKKNISLSIEPGNISTYEQLFSLSEKEMEQFMMNLNVSLVTDSTIINKYKEFFALIQSDSDIPLMFHCSAGKDRTGMAAALILYALGVDEETIIDDYLASNYYLADKYAPMKKQYPNMAALFEVRPNYIKAGLEQIKKDHISIDNYLKNVLEVDVDKMKQMYLY